jgi:hypothetical protein
MKFFAYGQRAKRSRSSTPAIGLLMLALLLALTLASSAGAAQAPVPLGTAGSFAILAHTGVTDTAPNSTINGDVGNDQTIATTGTPNVNGVSHIGDAVAGGARADLNTAIGFAAGAAPTVPSLAGGALPGTLAPGVYTFGHAATANLVGNLTLNGDANAVWIFQATSDLVTAVGSSVTLTGGASPCNVFWQVSSSATLDGSSFIGTVMASDSVTIGSGVTLTGRALAYTGDVTLINDTINAPSCATTSTAQGTPDREIYCDAAGKAYDLVAGENLLPPWNALGLVLGYTDPVTGSKSCNFPAVAPTATTPTPTPPTPTPPVSPKPAPKPVPKPAPAAGTAGASSTSAGGPTPRPARHPFGLTG